MRRRSIASASAPPTKAMTRIGTSSASGDQADRERGAGELEGLEGHGHERDHRPEKRDRLAEEEQPEIAVPPQRADVDDGEAGDPSQPARLRSREDRRPRREALPLVGAGVPFVVVVLGHDRGTLASPAAGLPTPEMGLTAQDRCGRGGSGGAPAREALPWRSRSMDRSLGQWDCNLNRGTPGAGPSPIG